MKCKSCGKEINDTAVFCEFCGTKVEEEITEIESPVVEAEETTENQILDSAEAKENLSVSTDNKADEILAETKEETTSGSALKKWYIWVIAALSVMLIVGLLMLYGGGGSNADDTSAENTTVEETSGDEAEESEEAVDENEETDSSDVAWTEKEYVVISLYNKKTKKTRDISSGFGLKVNTIGSLVNVNDDENGDYWGQVSIPEEDKDNVEVKIQKYGTGDKDIVIYINDSVIANGKNLCVYGQTSLVNVHPLMDRSDYEAQKSIDKDDTVRIEVE